ncbi:hypothetical protein EGR_02869 [Echinococcus granulosus]|uniref:Uncharacterized protein n=1 Tax=Echinococcus granulosus TaxID=6210 RepID=W6UMR8_ECHGR|nr:hypothetical protein EGR_02869 [Echinococcus granulosus]EUB62416.1 hypothetical protein EGR_02869 [Echinococcus granulosus]
MWYNLKIKVTKYKAEINCLTVPLTFVMILLFNVICSGNFLLPSRKIENKGNEHSEFPSYKMNIIANRWREFEREKLLLKKWKQSTNSPTISKVHNFLNFLDIETNFNQQGNFEHYTEIQTMIFEQTLHLHYIGAVVALVCL